MLALPSYIGAPSTGLIVARAVACFVGGANAYLIGRITRRYSGLGPALLAMLVYASLPEVAWSERTVIVEPYLRREPVTELGLWERRPDRP